MIFLQICNCWFYITKPLTRINEEYIFICSLFSPQPFWLTAIAIVVFVHPTVRPSVEICGGLSCPGHLAVKFLSLSFLTSQNERKYFAVVQDLGFIRIGRKLPIWRVFEIFKNLGIYIVMWVSVYAAFWH